LKSSFIIIDVDKKRYIEMIKIITDDIFKKIMQRRKGRRKKLKMKLGVFASSREKMN
jgi:hypothetical protein